MTIDLVNNKFYNSFADNFDKIPFEDILSPLVLKYLPVFNYEILEIGSGVGALASWLTKKGANVVCIEPAEKPAYIAIDKGLNVCQIRFQDFPVSHKFDSIFAISSLIHISKLEMPAQIAKISQLIKKEGIVFVSFMEGDSEGFEDPKGKGKNRFFSKFKMDELSELLSPYFSVMELHRIEVKKMNQLFLLMVLKPIYLEIF